MHIYIALLSVLPQSLVPSVLKIPKIVKIAYWQRRADIMTLNTYLSQRLDLDPQEQTYGLVMAL